ncbi:MAG TPA: DUF4395 domain-containing protein [Chitinophagaceae bacterium]|nr:DUF4395 domain-containing protein [Chitinophagaceae bacterium]
MNAIICPVSDELIDSNVSRLTVFLNVVLMALFIITLKPIFIYLVAADYFIRAALKVQYSPLRLVALTAINSLSLQKKPINLAPKIFASRLGFLCALASSVLVFLGFPVAAAIVAGFLMILSVMDSVFNFCVGCIIYNYIVYPFYHKK